MIRLGFYRKQLGEQDSPKFFTVRPESDFDRVFPSFVSLMQAQLSHFFSAKRSFRSLRLDARRHDVTILASYAFVVLEQIAGAIRSVFREILDSDKLQSLSVAQWTPPPLLPGRTPECFVVKSADTLLLPSSEPISWSSRPEPKHMPREEQTGIPAFAAVSFPPARKKSTTKAVGERRS